MVEFSVTSFVLSYGILDIITNNIKEVFVRIGSVLRFEIVARTCLNNKKNPALNSMLWNIC